MSRSGTRVAWWLGLAGHALVLPWYAASGLVAPAWAVACLLGAWVALLAVGLRLRRDRPLWVLLVPLVDVAVWFATISAGESLGGWTALPTV
jgi:hypothetical protein